jgi:hypothetical protein
MCKFNYNRNYNFWEEIGGNIVVLTVVMTKSFSGKTGISKIMYYNFHFVKVPVRKSQGLNYKKDFMNLSNV